METKKVKSTKTPNVKKETVGRPTAMTPETLIKLQYAFEIGASDREACLFAGIDSATLYRYQEAHPEYCDQKEQWKDKPLFIARQVLIKQIQNDNDGELALKYLERKKKDEFAPKSTVDFGVSEELKDSISKIKTMFDNAKKK